MALNDILRAGIISVDSSGGQWANVMHWRVNSDASDVYQLFEDYWQSEFGPAFVFFMGSTAYPVQIQLVNLTQQDEFPRVIESGYTAGNLPGESLPSFSAACIKTSGFGGGRSRQGRHFFAGLSVLIQDDGLINQQQISLFGSLRDLMQGTKPTDPGLLRFGIYSEKQNEFTECERTTLRPRISRLVSRQLRPSVV